MTGKPKSENIVSFLSAVLGRSGETPEDFNSLVKNVRSLADDVLLLAKSIRQITNTINEYGEAINELYALQTHILQQLTKSEPDKTVPLKQKNKDDKPN